VPRHPVVPLAIVVPLVAQIAAASSACAQQQLYQRAGVDQGDRAAYVAALGDVDGDGIPDFVVGAPSAQTNGVPTGEVDVRSGKDGTLIYTVPGDVEGFGESVANLGDVDGDKVNDFAVGSPFALNGASLATGAVWAFSGKTGAKIWETFGPKAYFGTTVAGIGDVDLDKIPDVIVGVPAETPTQSRMSLLSGKDGSLLRTALVGNTRGLGVSACGVGDRNNDGSADFLIGDFLATNGSGDVNAGRAYIYSGKDFSLIRTYDGEDTTDEFGAACAEIDDVDGDGVRDELIAAARAPSTGGTLGAAYVFSGATGVLIKKISDPTLSGYFATCVADAGDVNGDGQGDLLVGFTADDGRGTFVNGAWLYSGTSIVPLYRFEGGRNDTATVSLAGLGDVDGDGLAEVLVGALGTYRPSKADWDGMVRCYGGAQLYLAPTPREPRGGDTITFAAGQGIAGNLAATAIVAIDGVPTFQFVSGVVPLDANGQLVLTDTVPAGSAGHVISLQSFALDASSFIVRTTVEEITLR
jgi:FG-GAP repeat protein